MSWNNILGGAKQPLWRFRRGEIVAKKRPRKPLELSGRCPLHRERQRGRRRLEAWTGWTSALLVTWLSGGGVSRVGRAGCYVIRRVRLDHGKIPSPFYRLGRLGWRRLDSGDWRNEFVTRTWAAAPFDAWTVWGHVGMNLGDETIKGGSFQGHTGGEDLWCDIFDRARFDVFSESGPKQPSHECLDPC